MNAVQGYCEIHTANISKSLNPVSWSCSIADFVSVKCATCRVPQARASCTCADCNRLAPQNKITSDLCMCVAKNAAQGDHQDEALHGRAPGATACGVLRALSSTRNMVYRWRAITLISRMTFPHDILSMEPLAAVVRWPWRMPLLSGSDDM
jgi:hypothetical protein